jgi:hypothetical protein
MELIELVGDVFFASAGGCGCFFDIVTAIVDFFAARAAFRYKKTDKAVWSPKARNRRRIGMAVLLFFALFMTCALVYKWVLQAGAIDPGRP